MTVQSKTGSGKTLGYLVPMIQHALNQKDGEGPIGLILSPAKELAEQIFKHTSRACKQFKLSCLPLFTGVNMHEVWKTIKSNTQLHLIVSTPGKLLDMVN